LYTLGLDENDSEIFDRSLRVHLSSAHRLSEKCGPALSRNRLPGGASIIFIASMSSFFAYDLTPAYGVAKTGLIGLTRQLAIRWAKHRVRVNALAVGLTRSRMSTGFFADPALSEPFLARVPLGRHGEPHDIAGAALFLASDAASWITGQALPVDGGYSIKA
jgi:3-oxoacyl-[acyl-carrier protein] reductase